ncbi:uncharacterized protein LOC135822994 [Sycon ciliatum]|uniref:uncharacterized protein LOC135822994 n=1 Tax=Sycon ciliatum TaxID=27933 RepID=UPI0031F6C0CB
MPPKKASSADAPNPASTKRYRGKILRLRKSIQQCLDDGNALLSGAPSSATAEKLSETCASLESDVVAFDEVCELLSNCVDSSALESSDEAACKQEADDNLDFQFEAMSVIKKLKFRISQLKSAADCQTSPESSTNKSDDDSVVKLMQSQMKELLTIHRQTQEQTQSLLQQHSESLTTQASHKSTVNLPKLGLPKFNGDILQWKSFHDMFMASVHKHTGLSDVQKLSSLKEHVTHNALDTISGLSLSDANYAVALGLLDERYGNTQVQVNAHHVALMETPPATNKPSSLRKLYDTVELHLRSLNALEEDTDQPIFISLMTSKLPRHVLAQLELQKGIDPWSVAELRVKLCAYIVAQETAERQSSHAASSKHEQPSCVHKSSVLLVGESSRQSQPRKKVCAFCRESHYSDMCSKYSTLETRKPRLGDKCQRCLRPGHSVSSCSLQKPCFYCRKPDHHSSLCPVKFGAHPSSAMCANAAPFQPRPAITTVAGDNQSVVMQTAVVDVVSKSSGTPTTLSARILFDSGSCRSYVTQALQAKANLSVLGQDHIALSTFGSASRNTSQYPRVEVNLKLKNGSILPLSANVIPQITSPIWRVPLDTNRHPSLNTLPLAEPLTSSNDRLCIDILIGLDHYYKILGTDRISFPDGLQLLDSSLGFVCAGTVATEHACSVIETNTTLAVASHRREDPSFDLERFWAVEDFDSLSATRPSNDHAYDDFLQSVVFEDGRYTVGWPWRQQHPPLENNFPLAFGRLKSLIKRLRHEPDTFVKYSKVLEEQLSLGIIERVAFPSQRDNSHPIHYLPHHCVLKLSSSTTKIRVVYDASARVSKTSPSLNDCLYPGPCMIPDLCGILLRFRMHPIAVCSDIEKAFLQMNLNVADRDVTRFLWLDDPNQPVNYSNLQTLRFCRVPFGVVSSPFLLSATIKYHLTQTCSPETDDILRNTYVDNIILGKDTINDAVAHYQSAKATFSAISMNLREWASNSSEVLDKIPEHDRSRSTREKCLGLHWDPREDVLSVQSPNAANLVVTTKRQVLQALSRFFDPLGLFAPVSIRAKVLMQDIWKLAVSWDDPLPSDVLSRWHPIAADLDESSSYPILRYVGVPTCKSPSYQLHVFCDASAIAYAAVAYLESTVGDKNQRHIIFSKTKVSPVKGQTIPRLELMAASLGSRLIVYLRKQLDIQFQATHLYTDSTTVLHWLKSTKLPVFEQNRVNAIAAVPDVLHHYVPTKLNPADLPSRGLSAAALLKCDTWWNGPSLPIEGTTAATVTVAPAEGPPEVTSKGSGGQPFGQGSQTNKKSDVFPYGIVVNDFSSFDSLVRVSALCFRFLCRLRKKPTPSGPLTPREIEAAEQVWISHSQSAHYADVITALSSGKQHPLATKLNLVLDNGVLRCRGRLENADLCSKSRFPVLISKEHAIANLIIRDCHLKVMHGGVAHTLSRVRYQFWIPKGRSAVKALVRRCQTCIRYEGAPYKTPQMSPLPSTRVTQARPFSHIGLDYFGPVLVRTQSETAKAWVCLITCMVTRAVHLEPVHDMTAAEFLLALRRFVARRGTPELVVSDNAPQFKLAKSALDIAWSNIVVDTSVTSYISRHQIQWHFIVANSPWMGGMYERLVGIVKRSMRKTIGRRLLTTSQLATLLPEVESVVNSRPLVYVDEEQCTVLTPGHFISLSATQGFFTVSNDPTDPDYQPINSSADSLLDLWKKGQRHLDQFWLAWRNEYLLSLREAHTSSFKQSRTRSSTFPKPADVVLIKEELPRGHWRLGRIQEVHTSSDGNIRSATVLTSDKRTVKRPVSLLCPLETSSPSESPGTPAQETSSSSESPGTPAQETSSTAATPAQKTSTPVAVVRRPTRAAASKFQSDLQDLIADGRV